MYYQNIFSQTPEELQEQVMSVELLIVRRGQKMTEAANQMEAITRQIEYMQTRYKRAHHPQMKPFRTAISLKMSTLQGMFCMYSFYVDSCMIRMSDLYKTLQMLQMEQDYFISDCESD